MLTPPLIEEINRFTGAKPMKILAFAATSHSTSINRQLVRYAASRLQDAQIEMLDINDYELPLYSEDREAEFGVPDAARTFLDKIAASDALIIAFAEHNGSYTVAYKNLFDWASRINQQVYQGKPMLLLATSPGPGGAASVLASAVASAPFFDGEVVADLSIPSFYDNFNVEQGSISNDELNNQMLIALHDLRERTLSTQAQET